VLYAAEGLGNDEIAARLDTPRQVVSKWRKRFFDQRLAGLTDPPPGSLTELRLIHLPVHASWLNQVEIYFSVMHGAWIKKTGIDRQVLRMLVGNALIAITMLRHDVTAGLFAPVELLVTEEENGRSAPTYVLPSSLMVVEPNEALREAAIKLDASWRRSRRQPRRSRAHRTHFDLR
jgi:hypothetical protein